MIFHTIFYKPCKEGVEHNTYTKNQKNHKKLVKAPVLVLSGHLVMRRDGRVVEGARLESVYMVTPYQGFESLSLRHIAPVEPSLSFRWRPLKPILWAVLMRRLCTWGMRVLCAAARYASLYAVIFSKSCALRTGGIQP